MRARSGIVLEFGKLRIVDLGDLTWNKELELMCPENKLGHADIFVVSHHGIDQSNSPGAGACARSRASRLWITARKRAALPSAWDIIKSSPGLQDLVAIAFRRCGRRGAQFRPIRTSPMWKRPIPDSI